MYSFALKPEELQPSGSCNMSRIDHATLELQCIDDTVTTGTGSNLVEAPLSEQVSKTNVYAVNYNVLRIKNGMGGLAYSN